MDPGIFYSKGFPSYLCFEKWVNHISLGDAYISFFLIADKIPVKTKDGRLVWARSLRRDTIHRGGEGMVEEADHDP